MKFVPLYNLGIDLGIDLDTTKDLDVNSYVFKYVSSGYYREKW